MLSPTIGFPSHRSRSPFTNRMRNIPTSQRSSPLRDEIVRILASRTRSQQQHEKTKLLCVRNIRFFRDTNEIRRTDPNLTSTANTVQITFEFQKNREKFESVAMRRTGGSLCPVTTWISIVTRILSYPRGTTDSPVKIVRTGRSYSKITSSQVALFRL
jgi:hypothetical protein